ncbi:hypothetical protein BHE74_00048498 [Ensete ventricosum]|nr:hypothetical protein GW17_00039333 [Ensete ventricosum]RWW45642.1 hypothetical protein BHE74_00048498 [Ensete ventricosum]
MGTQDFFVEPEGCASPSRLWLGGREPKRAPYAWVNFRSLVELQPLEAYCDVLGRVVSWSRDLIRPALRVELLSFVNTSFYSSIGSSIINTCTKAVVGGSDMPPRQGPSDDQVSDESLFFHKRLTAATACSSGRAQAKAASRSATSGKWKLHVAPSRAAEAAQSATSPINGNHRMLAVGARRTRAQAATAQAAVAHWRPHRRWRR